MLIDFHTHCFPDTLAPRAIAVLSANAAPFGYTPITDGTVTAAEATFRAAGIDRGVVCSIATNSRQQTKVNDFAIAIHARGGILTALGSIHPDSDCIEAELDRLAAAGIRGIKIHPDYVGIDITDPRFAPILDGAANRGLFVITHAGFDPVSPAHVHATPTMLRRVLDDHPRLTLIAAHVGGMRECAGVLEQLVGTRIYLDTSLAHIMAAEGLHNAVAEILHSHDPARILFASDLPWTDPAKALAYCRSLNLPEQIYGENAARLLFPVK
ncbi:MAG: amidohydrolase family protein [Clostridia bacterium]|nr:amidohydrolase family protein [Clostridia bacterium]